MKIGHAWDICLGFIVGCLATYALIGIPDDIDDWRKIIEEEDRKVSCLVRDDIWVADHKGNMRCVEAVKKETAVRRPNARLKDMNESLVKMNEQLDGMLERLKK